MSFVRVCAYIYNMSGKRDSNPRPSAWEANALPTELLPQKALFVRRKGVRAWFQSLTPLC